MKFSHKARGKGSEVLPFETFREVCSIKHCCMTKQCNIQVLVMLISKMYRENIYTIYESSKHEIRVSCAWEGHLMTEWSVHWIPVQKVPRSDPSTQPTGRSVPVCFSPLGGENHRSCIILQGLVASTS